MKHKNKLSLIAASLALVFSAPAVAQFDNAGVQQPVFGSDYSYQQEEASTGQIEQTSVQPPKDGNQLEKELTPLLRETSRKKAALELKRLDLELEKTTAEILKAQMKTEKIKNGEDPDEQKNQTGQIINTNSLNNETMGFSDLQNLFNQQQQPTQFQQQNLGPMSEAFPQQGNGFIPSGVPGQFQQGQQGQQGAVDPIAALRGSGVNTADVEPPREKTPLEKLREEVEPYRVLSIIGFSGSLGAKIAYGDQGGYLVKAGDILPDGKYVYKVTKGYIEVGEPPVKIKNDKEKEKAENAKRRETTVKIIVSGRHNADKQQQNEGNDEPPRLRYGADSTSITVGPDADGQGGGEGAVGGAAVSRF